MMTLTLMRYKCATRRPSHLPEVAGRGRRGQGRGLRVRRFRRLPVHGAVTRALPAVGRRCVSTAKIRVAVEDDADAEEDEDGEEDDDDGYHHAEEHRHVDAARQRRRDGVQALVGNGRWRRTPDGHDVTTRRHRHDSHL